MTTPPTTNTVEHGYELQVGDIIVSEHPFANRKHKVTRVTKKYAFVQYNDVAEGKYPRIFDRQFEALPRHQWSRTNYTIRKAKP